MAARIEEHSEIYKRIAYLSKKWNTSPTKLCIEITGSKGNLKTWQKGNISSPVLSEIADRLFTSTDYLLGKTEKETPSETGERWKAIYDKVDSLPDETKDKVLEKLPKLIDLLADQGQQADP